MVLRKIICNMVLSVLPQAICTILFFCQSLKDIIELSTLTVSSGTGSILATAFY